MHTRRPAVPGTLRSPFPSTLVAVGAITAAVAALVGGAAVGASPATRQTTVASTTNAIVGVGSELELWDGAPLRLTPGGGTWLLEELLAGSADTDAGDGAEETVVATTTAGTEAPVVATTAADPATTIAGTAPVDVLGRNEIPAPATAAPRPLDDPDAAAVVAAVAEAQADAGPDEVILVGDVGDGCMAAIEAEVVRPGPSPTPQDVMLIGVFPDDEASLVCDAYVRSIAVVTVSADDVPFGGADQAVLAGFVRVDSPDAAAEALAALQLPELPATHTRIAVLVLGCQEETAELVISASTVRAYGGQLDGSRSPDCVQAEYFVAVFDVRSWALPPAAEIVGSLELPAI